MRIFLVMLLLFAAPSWATVYKCKNANGGVEYQSTPCTSGQSMPAPAIKEVSAKKYVGEKIKLQFEDAEVRTIIQTLADFSGKKIIMASNVQGKGAFKYNDLPWDQVLDDVAGRFKLVVSESNGVINISAR